LGIGQAEEFPGHLAGSTAGSAAKAAQHDHDCGAELEAAVVRQRDEFRDQSLTVGRGDRSWTRRSNRRAVTRQDRLAKAAVEPIALRHFVQNESAVDQSPEPAAAHRTFASWAHRDEPGRAIED